MYRSWNALRVLGDPNNLNGHYDQKLKSFYDLDPPAGTDPSNTYYLVTIIRDLQ